MSKILHNIVETILLDNSRVIFVSPHLDDAIFSAGALLTELSKNKVPVTVINCFNEYSSPYTLSAKVFLSQCGYTSIGDLYKQRLNEDNMILHSLGFNVKNLGFEDALFRKKHNPARFMKLVGKIIPELIHLYPTYRWHIINNHVAKEDEHVVDKIITTLKHEKLQSRDYIFAPMGIGGHCDHTIVNQAVRRIRDQVQTYLWADFPYNVRENIQFNVHSSNLFVYNKNIRFKKTLIKKYTSQYAAIFPHGINIPLTEYFERI